MIGNDDLRIKITGVLNAGATIGEINVAIKGIEKKINKLKLNIKIDDKVTQTLNNFAKQMSKISEAALHPKKVIEEMLNPDGSKIKRTFFDGLQGEFHELTEKAKELKQTQLKTVDEISDGYEKLTKQVERYNAAQKKIGETHVVSDEQGINTRTINVNDKGKVTGYTDTYNREKEIKLEQLAAKQEQDLIEQMAKFREQSILRRREEERKAEEAQAKAINQNAELERKQLEKTEKENQRVTEKIAQGREKAIIKQQQEEKKLEVAQAKAINKNDEKTRQLEQQLELYKRQAQVQVDSLRSSPHKIITVDQNKALDDYLKNVKSLDATTPNLGNKMQHLQMDFKGLNGQIVNAKHHSISFADALRTAFEKFPVWLLASTSIYGTIAATKNLLSVIIDVDSAMVNLQKVMAQDTNFDRVMRTATDSAEKFGKTLKETLDAYEIFARQGYDEKDIKFLGEAGLVASNVGEIDTATASDYLTSALIQWNKETSEAMGIVDSWNNISNKYATTVEKLAQGQSKAASTAKVMGLSFDQTNAIIGTLTASTKQSGSEIGNFLKSVLPRLTSDNAQGALKGIGVSIFDDQGKMRNAIDIYSDVAEKFKTMDSYNKSIVTEGLAGKYHISRMSALLADLGSADSMYRKMANDSANSAGSALAENEKYMQSLEARIQKTRLEFEKMALAFGKSFLTEGFVQTLNGLNSLMNTVIGVTKHFGALPAILGLVGLSVGGLSKNLNGFVQNLLFVPEGMKRAEVATKGFGIALKTTLATTLASTGIGLLFVGLGVGIEFLLKKMGETRERSEALRKKNNELMSSFRESKDSITSLASEYGQLEKKINSGQYTNKDLERYKEIQNELAKLMPDLKIGEDQYGNAVLASADSIKAKVSLLEHQLEVQNKLDARQRKDDAIANYDTAKNDLEDYEKKLDDVIKKTNSGLTTLGSSGIKSYDDLISKINELQKKKESNGLDMFESADLKLLNDAKEEYTTLGLKVDDAKSTMVSANNEIISSTLATKDDMSASAKSMISDFSLFVSGTKEGSDVIDGVFSNLRDNIDSDLSFRNAFNDYGKAIDEYKEKIDKGFSGEELQKYKVVAVDAFEKVKAELIVLAKNGKLSKDSLETLDARLGVVGNSAILSSVGIDKMSKSTGQTKEEIMNSLALVPELADEVGNLGTATGETNTEQEKNISTIERLLGVTDDQISQAKDAVATYRLLAEQENLSATQSEELGNAVQYLSDLYPHLLEGKKLNIQAIQDEIKATDVLKEGFELLSQGKLTAEQVMSLVAAQASKARIDILKNELEYMQKVVDKYNEIAKQINDQIKKDNADGKNVLNEDDKITAGNQNKAKAGYELNQIKTELTIESDSYKKAIDDLAKGIDYKGYGSPPENKKDDKKSGSKDSKGSKSSDKPPPKYVSPEYQANQAKYNDQLDESQHNLEKLKESSEAYRKELDKQIPIVKNLMKVNDDEITRLAKRNEILNSKIKGVDYDKLKTNDEKELYNKRVKEIEENEKSILSLTSANRDYSKSLDDIAKKKKDSILAQQAEVEAKAAKKIAEVQANYAATLAKIDKQIADSQRRQSRKVEGSKEWADELKLQNEALEKKAKLVLAERDALREALRTEKLSAEEKENLKQKIDELSDSYHDLDDQIYDNKAKIADDVIEVVKKAIETERDLKLDAIDDEIEALDKAYKHEMDLIDKKEAARDQGKEMSKLQKEQLALQSQINLLALDDSQSAKAKRLELQKKLAELTEQIEEKQHDRSIELQKDSLSEQYDNMKEAKEDERKLIDRKYSDMLNDEQHFADMRKDIIAGNLTEVQGLLGTFLTDFEGANQKTIDFLGVQWENLKKNIQDAQAMLASLNGSSTPSTSTPSEGSSPNNPPPTGSNNPDSNKENKHGRIITGTFKNGLDAADLVDKLQLEYSADAKMSMDGELYRVIANFSTFKKAEDVFKRLKDRGLIHTGRVEEYHVGGVVGQGDRVANFIDSITNIRPDEQIAKLKNGETVLNKTKMSNLIGHIQNLLIPKSSSESTPATIGSLVHIENFNGTRAEADSLGNILVNKMKNSGFKV